VWVSSEVDRSTEGAVPCGAGADSSGTGSISTCLTRRVFFNLDLTEIQGFFIYVWSKDKARDVYGPMDGTHHALYTGNFRDLGAGFISHRYNRGRERYRSGSDVGGEDCSDAR